MTSQKQSFADTPMLEKEITARLNKASSRRIGSLTKEEKIAGGRVRIRLRKNKFTMTHKYPGRYSACPCVLRGSIEDMGKLRRIHYKIGKFRPVCIMSAFIIMLLAIAGIIRIFAGAVLSGIFFLLLAILLFPIVYIPSREEKQLLINDLDRICGITANHKDSEM